jgi:dTDP-4-amino-4,6-dideoxy-D-galactose acyltransferase
MMMRATPVLEKSGETLAFLAEHLPYAPHDFIFKSQHFLQADRSLRAEHLMRALPPEHDLRFVYDDAQEGEIGVFAEILPWDTAFFGYGIARLDAIQPLSLPAVRPHADLSASVRHLLTLAKDRGVRYLFAPVFPEDLSAIRALSANGFTLIETRVTYHRSLTDYQFAKRFPMRAATAEDIPSLGHIAATVSNQYDRFHADPFITPASADRLMHKWIEASVSEGFADIVLVPDTPQPGAFLTIKYHRDKWERWGLNLAQPILSAVSPEFQGTYLKLISEGNYHLQSIGASHCVLVTQITNRAVIRTWEKLGFSYGRSEHIFRVLL